MLLKFMHIINVNSSHVVNHEMFVGDEAMQNYYAGYLVRNLSDTRFCIVK